jgi:hypothetical protein
MRTFLFNFFCIFCAGVGGEAASIRGSQANFELSDTRQIQSPRHLVEDFSWLSCNKDLYSQPCTSFVTAFGVGTVFPNQLVVPCGKCIILDHPGPTLTLQQGLDIQGKLVIPNNPTGSLTIQAPMVVVQGELFITATRPVDGVPVVKFFMTGSGDKFFQPIDSNAAACGGGQCNVGTRSITVAGGSIKGTFTLNRGHLNSWRRSARLTSHHTCSA